VGQKTLRWTLKDFRISSQDTNLKTRTQGTCVKRRVGVLRGKSGKTTSMKQKGPPKPVGDSVFVTVMEHGSRKTLDNGAAPSCCAKAGKKKKKKVPRGGSRPTRTEGTPNEKRKDEYKSPGGLLRGRKKKRVKSERD